MIDLVFVDRSCVSVSWSILWLSVALEGTSALASASSCGSCCMIKIRSRGADSLNLKVTRLCVRAELQYIINNPCAARCTTYRVLFSCSAGVCTQSSCCHVLDLYTSSQITWELFQKSLFMFTSHVCDNVQEVQRDIVGINVKESNVSTQPIGNKIWCYMQFHILTIFLKN